MQSGCLLFFVCCCCLFVFIFQSDFSRCEFFAEGRADSIFFFFFSSATTKNANKIICELGVCILSKSNSVLWENVLVFKPSLLHVLLLLLLLHYNNNDNKHCYDYHTIIITIIIILSDEEELVS